MSRLISSEAIRDIPIGNIDRINTSLEFVKYCPVGTARLGTYLAAC